MHYLTSSQKTQVDDILFFVLVANLLQMEILVWREKNTAMYFKASYL